MALLMCKCAAVVWYCRGFCLPVCVHCAWFG